MRVRDHVYVPGRTVACHVCRGEGFREVYDSHLCGSGPDSQYREVPCDWCKGAGVEDCEVCGEPATAGERCGGCADEARRGVAA